MHNLFHTLCFLIGNNTGKQTVSLYNTSNKHAFIYSWIRTVFGLDNIHESFFLKISGKLPETIRNTTTTTTLWVIK